MERLSREKTQAIGLLKQGRSTTLRGMLLQLEIGEAVFLKNEEWKAKRLPYEIAARLQKTHGLKFEWGRHPAKTGWVFKLTG